MQIHVDRAAFVEAATKAASFADDPMPIVRIDAGERVTFSATNNERFCRIVIDGNVGKRGAIVVDAHRIAAVAKGLTGSVVEITSTDSRMTIKGGATYTVPIVDPIDIMAPEFPEEHADVNGAALARAMTATSYAIGGGLTKSGVPGVWMEQRPDEVLVTSTDGHLSSSSFDTGHLIFLIKEINLLCKLEVIIHQLSINNQLLKEMKAPLFSSLELF